MSSDRNPIEILLGVASRPLGHGDDRYVMDHSYADVVESVRLQDEALRAAVKQAEEKKDEPLNIPKEPEFLKYGSSFYGKVRGGDVKTAHNLKDGVAVEVEAKDASKVAPPEQQQPNAPEASTPQVPPTPEVPAVEQRVEPPRTVDRKREIVIGRKVTLNEDESVFVANNNDLIDILDRKGIIQHRPEAAPKAKTEESKIAQPVEKQEAPSAKKQESKEKTHREEKSRHAAVPEKVEDDAEVKKKFPARKTAIVATAAVIVGELGWLGYLFMPWSLVALLISAVGLAGWGIWEWNKKNKEDQMQEMGNNVAALSPFLIPGIPELFKWLFSGLA